MNTLSNDAIDLLSVLMQTALDHARGMRDDLTIDLVELNGKLGGKSRTPWRNEHVIKEALTWCNTKGVPPFALLMVLDAGYRYPDGALLREAFPKLSRADSRAAWERAVNELAALDAAAVSEALQALPAKEEAPKAAVRSTGSKPAAAKRSAALAPSSKAPQAKRTAPKPPAASASATPRKGMTVHVQQIDRSIFTAVYQGVYDQDLIDEATDARLAARDAWLDTLDCGSWNLGLAGSGAVVEALQATIDDSAATWMHPNGVSAPNLVATLRRKDRTAGIATFETAVVNLFRRSLNPEGFLIEMKGLFNRQYALGSHLLFLADEQRFVPVDSQCAEAGLAQLGVDQSLSGACLWPSYSRFLSHLQRIITLAEGQGQRLDVQEAYSFLELIGSVGR